MDARIPHFGGDDGQRDDVNDRDWFLHVDASYSFHAANVVDVVLTNEGRSALFGVPHGTAGGGSSTTALYWSDAMRI